MYLFENWPQSANTAKNEVTQNAYLHSGNGSFRWPLTTTIRQTMKMGNRIDNKSNSIHGRRRCRRRQHQPSRHHRYLIEIVNLLIQRRHIQTNASTLIVGWFVVIFHENSYHFSTCMPMSFVPGDLTVVHTNRILFFPHSHEFSICSLIHQIFFFPFCVCFQFLELMLIFKLYCFKVNWWFVCVCCSLCNYLLFFFCVRFMSLTVKIMFKSTATFA